MSLGEALRLLSVRNTDPLTEPLANATGANSTLRLQLVPGAREKLPVQSTGVPVPLTCIKFASTLTPGEMAVRGALPLLVRVTDKAPSSESGEPALVAVAKLRLGASAKSMFRTPSLLV